MSYPLVDLVLSIPSGQGVTLVDKMVLAVLAKHASHDGSNAFPGLPRIADLAQINRRTAQRTLQSLTRRRFISTTTPHTPANSAVRQLNIELIRRVAAAADAIPLPLEAEGGGGPEPPPLHVTTQSEGGGGLQPPGEAVYGRQGGDPGSPDPVLNLSFESVKASAPPIAPANEPGQNPTPVGGAEPPPAARADSPGRQADNDDVLTPELNPSPEPFPASEPAPEPIPWPRVLDLGRRAIWHARARYQSSDDGIVTECAKELAHAEGFPTYDNELIRKGVRAALEVDRQARREAIEKMRATAYGPPYVGAQNGTDTAGLCSVISLAAAG